MGHVAVLWTTRVRYPAKRGRLRCWSARGSERHERHLRPQQYACQQLTHVRDLSATPPCGVPAGRAGISKWVSFNDGARIRSACTNLHTHTRVFPGLRREGMLYALPGVHQAWLELRLSLRSWKPSSPRQGRCRACHRPMPAHPSRAAARPLPPGGAAATGPHAPCVTTRGVGSDAPQHRHARRALATLSACRWSLVPQSHAGIDTAGAAAYSHRMTSVLSD